MDRLIEQAVTSAQVAYGLEAASDFYRGLHVGDQVIRYQRLLDMLPL